MPRALIPSRRHIFPRIKTALLTACLAGVLGASPMALAEPAGQQPNIVLILVDDSALMDFGAFGGEVSTPTIDALASSGAMFTQYRTSPLCAPTRAMLLTGVDNHRTGIATIPEVLPEEHRGQPGYSMSLEPGVLTIADRLRAVGYRTLMSGKWHMGEHEDEMPQNHGFDRSLALAASGADNWEDKSYMPYYADAPWFEDGKPVELPEDFYSSRYLVDRMIGFLDETDAQKPFFAYLPFQAIHIPVQAPPEFTANYKGRFDEGWHVLRAQRHLRAQALGLVGKGTPIAPMPEASRDWSSLSDEDRALYAARMEVNAGMLEAMDHHIGRLVEHLKDAGTFDNTIFVVTSDNGPEPNRGDHDNRLALWMSLNGYHVEMEGMGERGSWGFIGPEWANAAASPGDLFKFYATEGGLRVPLIISGPGVPPTRVSSPAMVTDVTPTLLNMVGETGTPRGTPLGAPQDSVPITGRSLLPVIMGETDSAYGPDDVRAIEVSGNAALYRGSYKITRSVLPIGNGQWRLYDMVADPGETNDLSTSNPDVMHSMLAAYDEYATTMGVLEMPAGYDSTQQIATNVTARMLDRYGWLAVTITSAVLLGVAGLWWAIRRRRHFA